MAGLFDEAAVAEFDARWARVSDEIDRMMKDELTRDIMQVTYLYCGEKAFRANLAAMVAHILEERADGEEEKTA